MRESYFKFLGVNPETTQGMIMESDCPKKSTCVEYGCQLYGAFEAAKKYNGLSGDIINDLYQNDGFRRCPFMEMCYIKAIYYLRQKNLESKAQSP